MAGDAETAPTTTHQPIAEFVESVHSRNGCSLARMEPRPTDAFDRDLSALVAPFAAGGMLDINTTGRVRWGRPGAI